MDFVYLAREAWKLGDFDTARMYYQKAAYSIHGTDKSNQDTFTQEVAQFAREDPVYQRGVQLIREYIKEQNKPVLQSDMTAYVKKYYGEQQTEVLRYVLYYAEVRKDLYRRKQGRSYLLALSEAELNLVEQPATKLNKTTKASTHLALFEPNTPYQATRNTQVGSNDIAELHREATRYKTEKNWEYALVHLFKAKELTENQYYDFSQRLRLPLFLQQAGQFEAAKYELAYLLNHIDHFVALEIAGRQNIQLQKAFITNYCLEQFFDKARLIFQREKQNEKMEKCAKLTEQYKEKRIIANEKLSNARKKRVEQHREQFPRRETYSIIDSTQSKDEIIRAKPTATPQLFETENKVNTPNKQQKKQYKPIDYIIGIIGIIVIAIIWWSLFAG